MSQLPDFDRATGRSPAIVSLYSAFDAPAPIDSLRTITADGAVPLVAWECQPVAAVASGADDRTISAYATALRDFGHPVFLRWFWEMNLRNRASERCMNNSGPGEYVAAWKRIRAIFRRVGATDVAFVWCPGVGGVTPSPERYFPGPQYVDWIGADGYDRHHEGAAAVSGTFAGWYSQFDRYGKPMMIAETGAMGPQQVGFLGAVATELPLRFPDIKAFVYFDARGPAGSWVLSPEGQRAFAALERRPYFAYRSS